MKISAINPLAVATLAVAALAPLPVSAAAAGEGLGKTPLSGEAVYSTVCVTCHSSGLLGSPRTGDREAWAALIAEGYEDLVGSALTGVRMMPPKGGEPALLDIEVARAVVHMAGLAGASFPEPTATSVRAARLEGEKRHRERLKKAAASRR